MQNGIVHEPGSDTIRLSIARNLRKYMSETYQINDTFLYLKNRIFKDVDMIKQIKLYPPENGVCAVIVVYEIPDEDMLSDNGRYLSIDLGVHNLMTCYDSTSEKANTFIIGRKYLSICRYYDKEIARIQSQWARTQAEHGSKISEIIQTCAKAISE